MRADKLINLVAKRRALWDPDDKKIHGRATQRELWVVIAKEMDATVSSVKLRWKGLRDTFRKEVKKVETTQLKSKWPFFKDMLFLLDLFTPSSSANPDQWVEADDANNTGGGDDPAADSDSDGFKSDDDTLEEPSADAEVSQKKHSLAADPLCSPNVKRAKCGDYEDVGSILERNKFQVLPNEPTDDADYHFLMSLLPFLKDIPKDKKMRFRMRLQQVFCDELYKKEGTLLH